MCTIHCFQLLSSYANRQIGRAISHLVSLHAYDQLSTLWILFEGIFPVAEALLSQKKMMKFGITSK